MKKQLGRILFWFKDEDNLLYEYTAKFTPLAMLLNRLINEKYSGKKIKFININFCTSATFARFEKIERNNTHSYGGHITHNSTFLRDEFKHKSFVEQKRDLWESALKVMERISADINSSDLKIACEIAYESGLKANLNEDFILLQEYTQINDTIIKAELWAEFEENTVSSKFKIYSDDKLISSSVIDKSNPDVEFFYEMYKKIEFDLQGNIILKGHYSIDYLPLHLDLKALYKKNVA
jgi:hypothetical protein